MNYAMKSLCVSRWTFASVAAVLVLVCGAAWVPAASAADPATSIVVDRFPTPIDSTDVMNHAGQYLQYRVRAYDAAGNLVPCNAGAGPKLQVNNPMNGSSQVIGQTKPFGQSPDGSSAFGMIMGTASGGGNLLVSCDGVSKRVIVQNDGQALQPDQQPANNKLIQAAGMGPTPPPQIGAPGSDLQPPQQTEQEPDQPTPAPEEAASGSGVGTALLITGAAVLTVAVVAIAASGLSSSSSGGGSCSGSSHQCPPPHSNICCPSGTTIYCTNNNTCTNQTLNNFGDICGSGSNSTAFGC